MAHMTECSLWKSQAGVESLKASLARENPNRLYIWESIANGLGNWFYDHCQQAKTDKRMRFIFCGFWSNPLYAIPRSDPDFEIYWDHGVLTEDEIKRARFVKHEYGVRVSPEQIAWWRRESEYRADQYMLRHYPWTETEAFISSGSGFFPAARTLEIGEAISAGPLYKGYRYSFEEQFLESKIEQTTDPDEVSLRVWEPPEPKGVYVIGIDPSGGGGEDADDHAIEVFRCYADRLVQVAEFASNRPFTYQLAWVVAHLCGAYRDHIANLEVTGIGAAVMPEVRHIRQLAERGILQAFPQTDKILDMIGCVRWFLYQRADSLGGPGNIINWKTHSDNKRMIFDELRNCIVHKNAIEIRSPRLVQQLQGIIEDEKGYLGAGLDTGLGDDLVCAAALAVHPWVETLRTRLVNANMSWKAVHEDSKPVEPAHALSFGFSSAYQNYMNAVHKKQQRRRERF
jgi:hypothetical protein